MNRYLDIGIRSTTLAVVSAPFFMWWAYAIAHPYHTPKVCTPGEYECRADKLDAHTTP